MKKIIFQTTVLFFCIYSISAQELTQGPNSVNLSDAFVFKLAPPLKALGPTVLSSGGGVNKYSDIELEWTLGESFIGIAKNDAHLYTLGFHQPNRLSHQLLYQSDTNESKISIFPNPVDNILNVQLQLIQQDFITLKLTDVVGRSISEQSVDGKATKAEVSVSDLTSGAYQLQVLDKNGKPISAFKIIKTN
jgi:Secretion system C-terminal sorting domain